MRILHTTEFYYPSVGGMQEVVKQISERLADLGHEVTVATTKLADRDVPIMNGVKIADFSISGNLVRGLSGEVEEYKKFLLHNDFDIITNFAAQQWSTDIMLSMLDETKAKKVFVPTGFSGLNWPEYKEYFSSMKVWMKQYDMNIFLSENYRDVNFARKNNVENICIIPNGADEREFKCNASIDIRNKFNIPKDAFLILHVGSHTGLKGHSESIEIFSGAQINCAVLMIVGNRENGCYDSCMQLEREMNNSVSYRKNNKRLIVRSLSREETVAAYKSADLFLFPSNIECSPIVLFECIASKTPFLVTDVGNSMEIINWTGSGILLPTVHNVQVGKHGNRKMSRIKEFMRRIGFLKQKKRLSGFSRADVGKSAKILSDIFYDIERRNMMAENGYKAWLERFTWNKIALQYEKLYYELLQRAERI